MVLFKSSYTLHKRPNLHLFTFHYGSIQIYSRSINRCGNITIYIPLWFYSNAYQGLGNNKQGANLHSTMVLFKSYIVFVLKCTLLKFTFHYGSIQIVHIHPLHIFYTVFTFHYGSIQI